MSVQNTIVTWVGGFVKRTIDVVTDRPTHQGFQVPCVSGVSTKIEPYLHAGYSKESTTQHELGSPQHNVGFAKCHVRGPYQHTYGQGTKAKGVTVCVQELSSSLYKAYVGFRSSFPTPVDIMSNSEAA
jgi:hypothetical protein